MKTCQNCNKEFEPLVFHKDVKCCSKKCRNNIWRLNNLDKHREYNAKWATSVKGIATKNIYLKKKWQIIKNNSVLHEAKKKKVRASHKKNFHKRQEYRKANEQRYRLHCLKRLELKKQFVHDYTEVEWFLKLYKTHGFCIRCDKWFGIKKLTMDHIVPLSKAPKGFVYTIDEIQPLCKSCNSSKARETIRY